MNVSSPTDSFLLWFVDHRGNIGMADDALNNAQARQDVLAAEINSLQQKLDERRRELTRVAAFIAEWHSFAGTSPPDAKPVIAAATPPVRMYGVDPVMTKMAAATGLAVTLVPYVPTISGNTTILRQTAVVAA